LVEGHHEVDAGRRLLLLLLLGLRLRLGHQVLLNHLLLLLAPLLFLQALLLLAPLLFHQALLHQDLGHVLEHQLRGDLGLLLGLHGALDVDGHGLHDRRALHLRGVPAQQPETNSATTEVIRISYGEDTTRSFPSLSTSRERQEARKVNQTLG